MNMKLWSDALPVLRRLTKAIEAIQDVDITQCSDDQRRFIKYIEDIGSSDFSDVPNKLYDALNPPWITKGCLNIQENGRYSIAGHELTCGSCLEIFVPFYEHWEDSEPPYYTWIYTTIEHNGIGYYFTARPRHKVAGTLGRI